MKRQVSQYDLDVQQYNARQMEQFPDHQQKERCSLPQEASATSKATAEWSLTKNYQFRTVA